MENNTNEFTSAGFTAGQLNAMVKKLGGPDAAMKFLRGELIVCESTCSWRERDGVIYLTVTSDGTTGPEWIDRLAKKGFRIGTYAESVLRSTDFKPTTGVTYEIAVLKGMLFNDSDRITKKIRAEAATRKLTAPNAEVACLIRENFSDKELETMGLYWVVVMHEPIKDSDGDLELLIVNRCNDGSWLDTDCDNPGDRWDRIDGFAFVVSQAVL